ncbi:MAG: hypothetical protein IJ882_03135, partial [Paludibacteraceae bacterium]|nr:hypothetical protein [Paludibacteraceae bacterium]
MIEEIKKRDGRTEPFDPDKIVRAITKAMRQTGEIEEDVATRIANKIASSPVLSGTVDVEKIQDMV